MSNVQNARMFYLLRMIALVAGAVTFTGALGAESLHYREVDIKNPGGKDLIMKFEELRRDDKTSLARVTRVSGASVPSIMFTVRGFYDIARARGTAYFVTLKEWTAEDGSWMYLVGFANDDRVSLVEYFGLTEPLTTPGAGRFDAVKDYDVIFKSEP